MYNPTKPYRKHILELIKETWETPYVSVREDVYPIIEKKFSYPEVDHTDGIGTKGVYHWQQRTFNNASLDALAMNLNDLALIRATPYKLQNHIFVPEDDNESILEIVKTLSKECKKRDIAITGGETSVHNNISGPDISMCVSGFIKNYKPNRFEIGDVLVGIGSNGLHSNGFTKVREVFGDEYRSEFISPTLIYSDAIFSLEDFNIGGTMHITGGAYTKLEILLKGNDAIITRSHKLKPQKIFNELYSKGISDEEMYRTFNCGIGFVLSVSSRDKDKIIYRLENDFGFEADVIGGVVEGSRRVRIESMFSNKEVEF